MKRSVYNVLFVLWAVSTTIVVIRSISSGLQILALAWRGPVVQGAVVNLFVMVGLLLFALVLLAFPVVSESDESEGPEEDQVKVEQQRR